MASFWQEDWKIKKILNWDRKLIHTHRRTDKNWTNWKKNSKAIYLSLVSKPCCFCDSWCFDVWWCFSKCLSYGGLFLNRRRSSIDRLTRAFIVPDPSRLKTPLYNPVSRLWCSSRIVNPFFLTYRFWKRICVFLYKLLRWILVKNGTICFWSIGILWIFFKWLISKFWLWPYLITIKFVFRSSVLLQSPIIAQFRAH